MSPIRAVEGTLEQMVNNNNAFFKKNKKSTNNPAVGSSLSSIFCSTALMEAWPQLLVSAFIYYGLR